MLRTERRALLDALLLSRNMPSLEYEREREKGPEPPAGAIKQEPLDPTEPKAVRKGGSQNRILAWMEQAARKDYQARRLAAEKAASEAKEAKVT